MTEISEAAKRKAKELLDDGIGGGFIDAPTAIQALARVLQKHSDAAKAWRYDEPGALDAIYSLILPDEPDALADLRAVLKEMTGEMPRPDLDWGSALIDRVSKGLAQRGKALKIVEAGDE